MTKRDFHAKIVAVGEYVLMERERNSLDTSLSTTCSKRRRGSLRCLLCLFVSVFSLCLPWPALCFDLSVFFVLYFFACFHTLKK